MKIPPVARWTARLGVLILLLPAQASAADLHVMISAGFYTVYSELSAAFERATGHKLITTRGPSMGDSPEAIPTRLARGELADVVIIDGGMIDELSEKKIVRPGSKVLLALSQVVAHRSVSCTAGRARAHASGTPCGGPRIAPTTAAGARLTRP